MVLGAALSSAAIACVVAACLPDLGDLPPDADASSETPPTELFQGCGDGVIETLDDGGDSGESCDPGDASPPGCESCQFTCTGVIGDAGHCYFLAQPTSSYSAAKSACANAAGHVVTFASVAEVETVRGLVAAPSSAMSSSYWVGLELKNDEQYGPTVLEPGWVGPTSTLTCPGCFGVGADDAGRFPTHPEAVDAGFAAINCLLADIDDAGGGGWVRVPCTGFDAGVGPRTYATVCEREPVGQRFFFCGGPNCTTLAATAGVKRYVIPTQLMTNEQAAAECSKYGAAQLLVLDSNEEREQIVRELLGQFSVSPPNGPVEVWLGLATDESGLWRWGDDHSLVGSARPLPWGANQPLAGIAGRAFLRITADTFDTQLVYTDDGGLADGGPARRVVVCQR